jgi:hypothetical protein
MLAPRGRQNKKEVTAMQSKDGCVSKFPKFEWKPGDLTEEEGELIQGLCILLSTIGIPIYIVENLEDIIKVPDFCIGITKNQALALAKIRRYKYECPCKYISSCTEQPLVNYPVNNMPEGFTGLNEKPDCVVNDA